MDNSQEYLYGATALSRRGFIKGTAAVGAAAMLYGCSGGDDGMVYVGTPESGGFVSDDPYYTKDPIYRYGTTGHNCGGKCITRAQLTADGRVSFLQGQA